MYLSDDGKLLLEVSEANLDANGQVDIPASVTQIARRLFQNYTGLTKLNLPQSLAKIGSDAFMDCTGLTFLHLSEGVEIGRDTFMGCTSLNQIIIDGDEEEVRRIRAMLPEDLQAIATVNPQYDSAQTHINEELNKLYHFTAETGPLMHAFFHTVEANQIPKLGDDAQTKLKEYVGEETSYHAEAREELSAIQLPTTVEGLEEYKAAVALVVAPYIEMAKAGTSIESDADADADAEAAGHGPFPRHSCMSQRIK